MNEETAKVIEVYGDGEVQASIFLLILLFLLQDASSRIVF